MTEAAQKLVVLKPEASGIPEGIVSLGSKGAAVLGFTAERFDGWLWRTGDHITISFIESHQRGSGNFRTLIQRIRELGFHVQIPTPLGRMQDIVRRNGYQHHVVEDEDMGPVELWTLPPL